MKIMVVARDLKQFKDEDHFLDVEGTSFKVSQRLFVNHPLTLPKLLETRPILFIFVLSFSTGTSKPSRTYSGGPSLSRGTFSPI
ncbi:hypothetical protein AB1N83_005517 [Pleurotus pulmonarius]